MKRKHRLSRSRDFDAVYRHGRSVMTRHLVLYTFVRQHNAEIGPEPRLGLAVSRRVGGAVDRNEVKRKLRAAFAQIEDDIPSSRDYVLVARPGLVEAAEAQGPGWLAERVREVFDLVSSADKAALP